MKLSDVSCDGRYDACLSVGSSHSWYALRTRSNYEKIAAGFLEAKGFEHFLPLCRAQKHREKQVIASSTALFPGYLFCRFDPRYRTPILSVLGVVSIVSFGGRPAQINDTEIEAVRKALDCGQNMEPYPYLHEGQQIRIEKGPLRGLEGILVKKRTWRIVISVEMLRRAVAVEIDPDSITPIGPNERRLQTDAASASLRQGVQAAYERPTSLLMGAQNLPLASA
ncbi:MAG TPA: transcription termination/antitermination NusG family protein [Terriglobales bacterium]|jgi:transcription antitermination factor NusG|nr:transcription termination/antitermination NusG family protein [Terriglobales bacterium]